MKTIIFNKPLTLTFLIILVNAFFTLGQISTPTNTITSSGNYVGTDASSIT